MLTLKQFLNCKNQNTIDYFNNLYKRFPIKNTQDESMKLYFNGLKMNNGKIPYEDDGLPELKIIWSF
jgi:hypothetical protein